jgi:hypothetical protein
VLLDVDIPEKADYHLAAKSGWTLLVAQVANPPPSRHWFPALFLNLDPKGHLPSLPYGFGEDAEREADCPR